MLRRQWIGSGQRLEQRLAGLTDDKFFWEPVPGCWTVRFDATRGGWTYDYEWPPPSPAPLTTIAWRLVHVAADNWIYWEHAFGARRRTFVDLPVPSSALKAVDDWQRSREPVSAWLTGAGDENLDELRPSHLRSSTSAGEVIATLVDEQVHHGAEIALLRDLYAHGYTSRYPA